MAKNDRQLNEIIKPVDANMWDEAYDIANKVMVEKVDKEDGKGLSSNDYTTTEKNKLANIEANANKYTHPTFTAGNAGPSADAILSYGGTFIVPYVSRDTSGHMNVAGNRTMTLPAGYTHPQFAEATAGPTANVSLSYGGSFNAAYVSRDINGHVSTVANRVITLPAGYTHPTFTALSGGPSIDATLPYGGTFIVPYVTRDANGHVSGIVNRTMTMPTAYTHPTFSTATVGPSANATLSYGGTFNVPYIVRDANGHTSTVANRVLTMPTAPADYVHPTFTATTAGPTANATVANSGSFNVPYVSRDANGHISDLTNKLITLPAGYTHPTFTAGSAGPNANATLAYAGTFIVPYVTRDANGHVSGLSNITMTLPASPTSVATLTTARYFSLTGGATGTATAFNGSANVAISVTALNVSTATAGTLPVARGGTGATSASDALTALGAAASSHTHNEYVSINSNPVQIGLNANASGTYATVIGYNARSTALNAVAIGANSNASAVSSIAIGQGARSSTNSSVAIGGTAKANGSMSIAIGSTATVFDNIGYGIAIGTSSSVAINSTDLSNGYDARGIAIGYGASTNSYGSLTASSYPIAIGYLSKVQGLSGIAIGKSSTVSRDNSIAIGSNASTTTMNNSIAIGVNARITGNCGHTFGSYSAVSGNYSTALGYYAVCTTANGIQLGNASSLASLSSRVSLTVTSDERDKADINPINKNLDFINLLEPIQYVTNEREKYHIEEEELTEEEKEKRAIYGLYKYDKEAHIKGTKKGQRKRVGLKAQDIVKALEEVYGSADYANLVNDNLHDESDVPEDIENKLTVSYETFVPFLIGAVQELSNQIQELKGENNG